MKIFKSLFKLAMVFIGMSALLGLSLYNAKVRSSIRDTLVGLNNDQMSYLKSIFGNDFIITSTNYKRYSFYPSSYIYDFLFQISRSNGEPFLVMEGNKCEEENCILAIIELERTMYQDLISTLENNSLCLAGENAELHITPSKSYIISVSKFNLYLSGIELDKLRTFSYGKCE